MVIHALITDADVRSGRVTSPIVLEPGTVLTPAARDRAVAAGLVIVDVDEARSPAHPTAGAASTAGSSGGCGGECGGNCDGCTGCQGGASGACRDRARETTGVHGHGAVPSGLADGLYLVRIEGGRSVSVLPATGPGLMHPPHTSQET